MTIEEIDKAIAEFMGETIQAKYEGEKLISVYKVHTEQWKGVSSFQYRNLWDELMPVVSKVSELSEKHSKVTEFELWMFLGDNKLHVCEVCTNFITWYNNQSKQN